MQRTASIATTLPSWLSTSLMFFSYFHLLFWLLTLSHPFSCSCHVVYPGFLISCPPFFFFNLDKDVPQDGLLLGSLRMPECDACHFFCGLLGWFGFSTCFVETLEICTNSRLSFFFSYLFFGGCVKQLFFTWEWLPNIPCPTAIILQFLVQSLSPHRLPAAENYFPYLQHFITYVAVLFHSLVNWCHFKFLRIHPWA